MEKEYQVLLLSHYRTIGKNALPVYNKVSIKCGGELICQAELKTDKGEIRKFEIPTFRVRDIPNVMTKQGWHMAARVQNAWFDGTFFQMKTDAQRKGGGNPRAPVRADLVTWNWLDGFERVIKARTELITSLIYNDAVKKLFTRKFEDLHKKNFFANIATQPEMVFSYNPANILQSHIDWQFQRISVDDGTWDKPMRRDSVDDLFAALGSFTLNAAIHQMRIVSDGNHLTITILKIAVYARDTYDFFEDQYLGHWNKDNMEIPTLEAAWKGFLGKESKDLYYPAAKSVSEFEKGKAYFPVGNSDYRAWQNKNQKGSDMLLFSDVQYYSPRNLVIKIKA